MGNTPGHRSVTTKTSGGARRPYDNTLRRERAAQTRDRIVLAGAELLREFGVRDWGALTVRAVAGRAGVNERTVFRHFANEKELRDAVMLRLEGEAGIDLTKLRLEGITDATARIFRHVAAYPRGARPDLDPTLAEASQRQHAALVNAVERHTAGWTSEDRVLAAAMFDVLWAVSSFERLVAEWHVDPEDAIRAVSWVIGLVQQAIAADRRPPPDRRKSGRNSSAE
jgi:AcrR family transcriptional regulator